MNENVENKAGDIVGDLATNDDWEMNDTSTSVEQEFQGEVGESDYNMSGSHCTHGHDRIG